MKATVPINCNTEFLLNSHLQKIETINRVHKAQIDIQIYYNTQWLALNISVISKTTRSIIHSAKGNEVSKLGP